MKVGGRQEGLPAAEPLLRAMGSRVVYCGGAGNGAVSIVSSVQYSHSGIESNNLFSFSLVCTVVDDSATEVSDFLTWSHCRLPRFATT
jgi:hypothetical protein